MKTRRSYLHSMIGDAAALGLPPVRPPLAPIWPVRALRTEEYAEVTAPADAGRSRNGASDAMQPRAPESIQHSADATAHLHPANTSRRETIAQIQSTEMPLPPKAPSRHENKPQQKTAKVHREEADRSAQQVELEAKENEAPARMIQTPPYTVSVVPPETTKASSSPVKKRAITAEPGQVALADTGARNLERSRARSFEPLTAAGVRFEKETKTRFKHGEIPARSVIEPVISTAGMVPRLQQTAAQSHNTVHIGNIDIHIAPAPAERKRTSRRAPASAAASLARGFVSPFGLRQG